MKKLFLTRLRLFLILFTLSLTIGLSPVQLMAQGDDVATLKRSARVLIDAQKFTEALPLYEALAKRAPNDPEVRLYLGFSLLGQAATVEDPAQQRALRVKARDSFILARDFGDKSLMVQGLIDGLPADGADGAGFSDNAEANKLMQKAEAAFASGKMDEALKAYKGALELDPRCYYAALFSGDVNMQIGNFAEAENWYQRAISINPNIETAYRYSATPLMKQNKYDLARDRYIEAFIVDPYNRLALSGIAGWGEVTKTPLGHPVIDVPEISVGADGKLHSTVEAGKAEDDSLAWSSYVETRELWRSGKFAKQFPGETKYRHTLLEEAEALRSVVSAAKALKPKVLNEQIATLANLDRDGVLEAFILMAMPDAGIAWDHRSYLLAHRDKLRQYVVNYVIGAKK